MDSHTTCPGRAPTLEPPSASAQPIEAAQSVALQPLLTQLQPLSHGELQPDCSTACNPRTATEPLQSASPPIITESSELSCSEPLRCAPVEEPAADVNELAAVTKVLQLLEQQLHSVNKDVEESVTGVCTGFHGMAQRAQAAVTSARAATVGNTCVSGEVNPLLEINQVLEELLKVVQSSCSFSQTAAERLAQLEKRLSGVEKVVREVEDIAGRAKMVALNGRIEASRLGVSGKAFGVVAQETKDLADKAGKTGSSIRQSINELAIDLFKTTAEMRRRAESDSTSVEYTNSAVHQLLSKLEQTHHQMNNAMTNTASISLELQKDIGKAVVSMQFQDRVSQRVHHVVETLACLVELIDPWCTTANNIEAQRHFESWQAKMASRYTMDSERCAGIETQMTEARSRPADDNHAAELF